MMMLDFWSRDGEWWYCFCGFDVVGVGIMKVVIKFIFDMVLVVN